MSFLSDHFFSESVTLQRPTVTKDSMGGSVRAWSDVGDAPVPASVQPLSTSERALQGTRLLGVTHQVFLQSEPSFKRGDRLRTSRGKYYRVVGVRNELFFDSLWVVDAREVIA